MSPNEGSMPPFALHHQPFFLQGRGILHVRPWDNKFHVVVFPQVKLTPGYHTGNVEEVAKFIQSQLQLDTILLTLLLLEHQEPRQVLLEPWRDLKGG